MGRKDLYQERLDAQLWEWDAKIEELKANATRATSGVKLYRKRIEKLRNQYRDAERKLEEFMMAGEEALDELKADLDRTWDELKRAVESASSEVLSPAAVLPHTRLKRNPR
jgi:chromosome segregation ATPase